MAVPAEYSLSPEYRLGFDAGYRYAVTPRTPQLQKPTAERKLTATITFVIGIGSAAAVVAAVAESEWRKVFAVFGIGGIILGTILSTARVLDGGPAPWEL